jgi:hypothetical protein
MNLTSAVMELQGKAEEFARLQHYSLSKRIRRTNRERSTEKS